MRSQSGVEPGGGNGAGGTGGPRGVLISSCPLESKKDGGTGGWKHCWEVTGAPGGSGSGSGGGTGRVPLLSPLAPPGLFLSVPAALEQGGFCFHSGGWVVGRTTCSRCPRRGDVRTRARAALPPRLPGAPPAPRLDGLCEGQGPAAASRLLPIVIICFLNHIKEEKPSLGTKRQIITIKLKCKLSWISVHTWVKAA